MSPMSAAWRGPVSGRAGLAAACVLACASGMARAGGGPENALLIIDPNSAESLYVGNYYRAARNLPDANVLYMDPNAGSYQSWSGVNLNGFNGKLAQSRIADHIDYVIVTPGNDFLVPAPGLISDGCFPVTAFSIASVYTMAQIKSDIVGGGLSSQHPNMYYSTVTSEPRAFRSTVSWLSGSPSTSSSARRYYIGAMLGSTAAAGNTIPEILAMIDRSVAADGTRPAGTFYFMDNSGDPARNVRAPQFPATVSAIAGLGGTAQTLAGLLPPGGSVCLGVMSGFSNANIVGQNMVIVPGAFCDHLTSYAGVLSGTSQSEMSEWIRAGASGSAGTVEEPCNYLGKFNNPRFHAFYYQGMSLGEAYLRTMAYIPFQNLLYGDPLTRPFARIPTVSATLPGSAVAGMFQFTPTASTTQPGAFITSLDLLIDGVLYSSALPGFPFSVNTTKLTDGWHDVRVMAYDSTLTQTAGRWAGSLLVNNGGRSSTVGVTPGAGNLTKVFTFDFGASGGTLKEMRLLHNGRVVAARDTLGPMFVWGQTFGAGPVSVQAEAEFTDGSTARSAPIPLNIDYSNGTLSGLNPVAFTYTKRVFLGSPAVVELPATFDTDPADAVYTLVTGPSQGTLAGDGAWRVLTPNANACGQDTIVFRVQTPSGQSGNATVKIVYRAAPVACVPDFNGDGQLNLADFGAFQTAFALGQCRADINGDGQLNLADFGAFQTAFALGCQ
jgi:hypothetical protein